MRRRKCESQKSCFSLYLEFRIAEQNSEILSEKIHEKVTRETAGKKFCVIKHLYFWLERGT